MAEKTLAAVLSAGTLELLADDAAGGRPGPARGVGQPRRDFLRKDEP